MINEKQKEIIKEFELSINLPQGFVYKLLDDDDWSFVIKLHSLLEAAISYSLSESIKILFKSSFPENKISLQNVFTNLETSNKLTGKIAFLKGLDLPADANYRGLIQHLSRMRNAMVHNINKVGMTIKEYYSSLEMDIKKDFLDKMTFTIDREIEYDNKKLDKNQLFELEPKIAIWINSAECILELFSVVKILELRIKSEDLEKKVSETHKKFYEKFAPIFLDYINPKLNSRQK
jgi:hypothetical protein